MDRNPQTYTEAEVTEIMRGRRRASRVDLGPGQILYRYAKAPGGGAASVADLIGASTARRTLAYNLHLRHRDRRMPWGWWPLGNTYSHGYAAKIWRLAVRLMRGRQ
jgi:hypothetical protein